MLETPKLVRNWLILGLVLIFFQIIIGGVTRLTGSGLSITKWEIVFGTFPPFGEAAWHEAFDLYKATPQYQKINEGMSLAEFQFIYFWEYLHRLWARTMGIIFIIPFLLFYRKGWIDKVLLRRLGWVVFFAALAASLGWIMVKSGLQDRPWVNAYKLALHLLVGLMVFISLLWAYLGARFRQRIFQTNAKFSSFIIGILILIVFQLILGGLMSGMKAGLLYPTWPQMHGEWIPSVIIDSNNWIMVNAKAYDKHPFMIALVQFLHRNTAYLVAILIAILSFSVYKKSKDDMDKFVVGLMLFMVMLQILLGILTVLKCLGHIPVLWGVLHQAGAILLFGSATASYYLLSHRPLKPGNQ